MKLKLLEDSKVFLNDDRKGPVPLGSGLIAHELSIQISGVRCRSQQNLPKMTNFVV